MKKLISCVFLMGIMGMILGFSYSVPKTETETEEFPLIEENTVVVIGRINNTMPYVISEEPVEHQKVLIMSEIQADQPEETEETKEEQKREIKQEIKEEVFIEEPSSEAEAATVHIEEPVSDASEEAPESIVEELVTEEPVAEEAPTLEDIAEPEIVEKNVPVAAGECIIPVELLGNVDESYRTKAAAQLAKIPRNLQQAFIDRGWNFYVTDENIAQTEFGGQYKSVMGVTISDCGGGSTGRIKIEDRERAINGSVIHEFGHFVYYSSRYTNVQPLSEAMAADMAGAKKMGMTYGLDSVSEYYAECFYFIIKNPEKCSQYIPNTYSLIMEDISSF